MKQLQVLSIFAFISLILCLVAQQVSTDRQGAGRRLESNNGQRQVFRSSCGTSEQVSSKVGRCLDPIFDLVEGKFDQPKSDEDLIGHCNRFNATERCVRNIAKECLTGLHKTATSSIASATKRFSKQECRSQASRGRYQDPLICAISEAKLMSQMLKDHTAMAQAIRDLPNTPEEKLIKICCLLNKMDKEIETIFNKACPKSTPLVIGIIHAMTDDARSTLCLSPKCAGSLDRVSKARMKQNQNFIEPVMQVLFMLSTN